MDIFYYTDKIANGIVYFMENFNPLKIVLFAVILAIPITIISSIIKKIRSSRESHIINKYFKTKNQEDGRKALFFLINQENTPDNRNEIIRLIKAGVNVNLPDENGNTALIEVSKNPKEDFSAMVSKTISAVKVIDGKEYPCDTAKTHAQILITSGADINIKNNKGNTALIEAALNDNYYMVKFLLDNGADVNTLPNDTSLIIACENNDFDKVKSLIEKGANVNYKTRHDKQTPLMFACENGSFEIVKLLIEKGANINVKDGNYEQTPLFFAWHGKTYQEKKTKEQMDIIKFLISKGANVDEDLPIYRYGKIDVLTNNPLLMYTCAYNDVETSKILLENGANVNNKNSDGSTPLSMALRNQNTELVELLKSYGAKE